MARVMRRKRKSRCLKFRCDSLHIYQCLKYNIVDSDSCLFWPSFMILQTSHQSIQVRITWNKEKRSVLWVFCLNMAHYSQCVVDDLAVNDEVLSKRDMSKEI